MKSLIENCIHWNQIGRHPKAEYHYTLGRISIERDTKILSVEVCLNFIMPLIDVERVEELLRSQFPELRGVRLRFTYEDVILSPEEIIKHSIRHMIREVNGEYAHLTATIFPDQYTYKDGCLSIMALGENAVAGLSEKVAGLFSHWLAANFGLQVQVAFFNDQECYQARMEEQAKEEQEELERVAAASANEAAKAGASAGKTETTAAKAGTTARKAATGGKKDNSGWKKKKQPASTADAVFGRGVKEAPAPISELRREDGTVVIEGVVFRKDNRTTKSNRELVSLILNDPSDSICVKLFAEPEAWAAMKDKIKVGDCLRVRGKMEYDSFESALVVIGRDISKVERQGRKDNSPEKRVELHAHTKMSNMDGFIPGDQLVKTARAFGHKAVAVTDHGVLQSFPDAMHEAESKKADRKIKVIYGLEGYLLDDSDQAAGCQANGTAAADQRAAGCQANGTAAADQRAAGHQANGTAAADQQAAGTAPAEPIDYKSKPTYHIILLAANRTGLLNLYKLVSYSHLDYFYRKPRLPRSVIAAHREGLIVGSACEAGELFQAVLAGEPEETLRQLASFYDYLEIQPLCNNEFLIRDGKVPDRERLQALNRKIVELGHAMGKPVAATCDAHYTEPEEALYRRILMAGQGFKDAESGEGLFFRTTEEMLEEFAYLGTETAYEVVVTATNQIADSIEEVRPIVKGKFPPHIDGDKEKLRSLCEERARATYGPRLPEIVAKRLEKELSSIITNGYAVMYMAAKLLVQKSLSDGYLVGSRGSVGSSLAATMAGITEVNPLPPHYICTEDGCWHTEFITDGSYDCGADLPDKNCPLCGAPMKKEGFNIPFETFLGFEGNKEPDIDLNFAGEYQSVAHKYVEEIFGRENVFRAGTISTVESKTAYGFVMKYYEAKGEYVNKWEADRLTACCTGVRRTTGQHPGGIIIVPRGKEIYEFCPVQHPANDTDTDIITTHFDYHSIDENLLKLDILGHDVPTMLRMLRDMTGVDPLTIPLGDQKVMALFNGTESLNIQDPNYPYTHGSFGIPEFGTSFVRQMLDDIKPTHFADLVRISGFSHGTNVWLNNAKDFIRDGTATIQDAIATRDDIMNYLIIKGVPASDSFKIMESVRRGNGVSEEEAKLMADNNVPEWYVESCRRISYMFPKAHAVAYTLMSYRMAYYKIYHPAAFYAAIFSIKVDNFNYKVISSGTDTILKKINEVEEKGKQATQKEIEEVTVFEIAVEMLARNVTLLSVDLEKSEAGKFVLEGDSIRPPFRALGGMGDNAAKRLAEEAGKRPFFSKEELQERTGLNRTAMEALTAAGVLKSLAESDQLTLF